MKLFYKPGACSLSSHMILYETGLRFKIEKVDLVNKKTENGLNYLDINPKGQIPALKINDNTILTENTAILLYLSDLVPDAHLTPEKHVFSRYNTIEWLNYIATELHKNFSPLFNPKTPESYKTIVKKNIKKNFYYLNTMLTKNNYLLENNFSIADAYLFPIIRWAIFFHFNIQEHIYLQNWFNRINARSSVIKVLIAEGLK
ncbi:Glutathione S-transferase GST-6.0 [Candidatus Ecksteinia adelgidicola]|nr:Glutathione S-transferase GST-6.0 [Candidatus Ecksteinia adelgidicola]